MVAPLVVHGFETSNNRKVRVALGYKGLSYAFRTIDPADRASVLAVSGQHLTPVLEHGSVVLCDSAAILRYLDANFRDTPRLFGSSVAEQWEIEDWELFGRTRLAGPMLRLVHQRMLGQDVSESEQRRCAQDFGLAVDEVAERLAGREYLIGAKMSAADITCAAVLQRVHEGRLLPEPASAAAVHVVGWRDRVMAFDGPGRSD